MKNEPRKASNVKEKPRECLANGNRKAREGTKVELKAMEYTEGKRIAKEGTKVKLKSMEYTKGGIKIKKIRRW